MPRAKHVPPRRTFPPLSTGPSLNFNGAVRAEPKGTPSGTPPRGSTDTSRLSEGGPGAGAPHGILAGPRQPLVPFPCGKGTRASADARNSLKPHLEPRPCAPSPHPIALPCSPSQLLSASIPSNPKTTKKEKPKDFSFKLLYLDSGNVLLSRAVSSQVPSALKGLTSVFGMGTGGTPSPSSPEIVNLSFSLTP